MNVSRLGYVLTTAGLTLPKYIVKRDGSFQDFDINRIEKAVASCLASLSNDSDYSIQERAGAIAQACAFGIAMKLDGSPTVEAIQNLVEITLLTHGEVDAARAYMSYRDQHAKIRGEEVPDDVVRAFEKDKDNFPTPFQQFNFYDKYSRFNWELGRRETWEETVNRTVDHLKWEVDQHEEAVSISDAVWYRIHDGILKMRIMPSMRLLAMAGPAAQRNSVALYNCSYIPVFDIQAFVEALLISMAGSGVGYSVEKANVEKFPRVQRQTGEMLTSHWVDDSAQGWGDALCAGLSAWWAGSDVEFNYAMIRPQGAVLVTKGGRASGPGPLQTMLGTIRAIILKRQGSFISTLDAHDIMCNVAEGAVSGGVRRSAMISLFDFDDQEMRNCKNSRSWWETHGFRKNANNSAVWPDNISDVQIMHQMTEMMFGEAGEPGIFSRAAVYNTLSERRRKFGTAIQYGTNPCGEILLRPFEFCNLSQAIAKPGDTIEDLYDKVELATIIGTIQSLSTRFPGLRAEWKVNAEQERLLGVDLTAQNDCELLRDDNEAGAILRRELKQFATIVNEQYANLLGIAPSASITCNKPAGNSTGFIGAGSSGIHKSFASHYIRRARISSDSPVLRVLKDAGAPIEDDVMSKGQCVVSFPLKAPAGAKMAPYTSAIEQLNFWLLNKRNWTSHNPSCTISYGIHEVAQMTAWVCEHKNEIAGISFLPRSGAIYPQMPYEEIEEKEYLQRVADFPAIDYSLLYSFERSDMSNAATTLSCFSGQCDI